MSSVTIQKSVISQKCLKLFTAPDTCRRTNLQKNFLNLNAYYKPSKFTFSEILPRQVALFAHDGDGWLNWFGCAPEKFDENSPRMFMTLTMVADNCQ